MSSLADTSAFGQATAVESTNLQEKLAGTAWGKGASKLIVEAGAAPPAPVDTAAVAQNNDKESTNAAPAANPVSSNWRNALMANYQGAATNVPATNQRRFQSDGDNTAGNAPHYRGNRREHHHQHNRNEDGGSGGRFDYLRHESTPRQGVQPPQSGNAAVPQSTQERPHLKKAYYHSGQHPPTTREFKPRPTEMVGLQERTRTPATITVPPVVPFPPTKMVPSPNFSGKEGSGEPDGIIRYSRDFILSLFRPSLQPPETHFVEIEGITTIDSLAPATITWEKAHPIPANLLTEDLVVTPALSRAYAFGEIYNSWEREAQRDHVRKGGKVYGKEIPPGLARHSHPYHRTNAPHGAVNYEGSERPAYDSFGQRQGASESAASQASSSSMNGDVAHAVHTPAPQSAEASSEQTVSGVAAFKDSVNQQDAPKDENGPKQTAPEVYDTEVEAWYYKDSTGEIQGPFSGKRMWDWYQLGYFGKWPHLPVSYRNKDNFTPMSALFSNPATAFLIAPPTPGPREDRQEQAAHVAAKPQSYPHHAGQVQHTSESQYPAQGNPDAMNMRVPNYARDLNMSGAAGPAGPYQDGSMHGASHGVKYPQGGDAASAAHPNPRAQWSNARGFLEKLFADHMQIRREKDNTTHVLTKLQSHYNMVCVRMNEMEESMKNISNQMMHMGPNARASQHMEEIKRQYAESQNERHVVQTEMMFQNKVLSSHMQALDTLGEEIAKIQHQISELEKRHGINEGMGEFPADAYPFNSKGQPMQPMMNMFQHMSVSGPNANEAGAMHGMERSGMNTGMRYPHSGSEMVNRQAPWHPTHPRSN